MPLWMTADRMSFWIAVECARAFVSLCSTTETGEREISCQWAGWDGSIYIHQRACMCVSGGDEISHGCSVASTSA